MDKIARACIDLGVMKSTEELELGQRVISQVSARVKNLFCCQNGQRWRIRWDTLGRWLALPQSECSKTRDLRWTQRRLNKPGNQPSHIDRGGRDHVLKVRFR